MQVLQAIREDDRVLLYAARKRCVKCPRMGKARDEEVQLRGISLTQNCQLYYCHLCESSLPGLPGLIGGGVFLCFSRASLIRSSLCAERAR